MTRKKPRRPAHGPAAVARLCLWPGCGLEVGKGRIMDDDHWGALPWPLRSAWIEAAKRGASPEALAKATADITAYARQQSLTDQGADAK